MFHAGLLSSNVLNVKAGLLARNGVNGLSRVSPLQSPRNSISGQGSLAWPAVSQQNSKTVVHELVETFKTAVFSLFWKQIFLTFKLKIVIIMFNLFIVNFFNRFPHYGNSSSHLPANPKPPSHFPKS